MDFGATAAGGALTAALVGLIYGVHKLMQRSRCASHTRCCDFEVTRLEQELERERTERATAQELLRDFLGQMGMKKGPPQKGEPGEIVELKVEDKNGVIRLD